MSAHARGDDGWTQQHIRDVNGIRCGAELLESHVRAVSPPVGRMPETSTIVACHECFEAHAMAISRGDDGWDHRWHIATHVPKWSLLCGGDPMAGCIFVAGAPDWRIHKREEFCAECLRNYEIETGW